MSNVIDLGKERHAQLSLFSEVLHAYNAERGGVLDNKTLYKEVARRAGIDDEDFSRKEPIGKSGQQHSVLERRVRWWQQDLRRAGILEHVEGERGVWRLTQPATEELNEIKPGLAVLGFSTDLGIAVLGSCETVFSRMDAPIDLVVTSPPYALAKERAYGNVSEAQYVDWFCKVIEPVIKAMAPGASICINVTNDLFMRGSPARTFLNERLLLALHDRFGLFRMDTLIWNNPSKPPGPTAWACKDSASHQVRVQLAAGWEPVLWLTNDPTKVRSDNRRVLQPHSERHLRLIRNGGEKRAASYSDGAYTLKPGSFGKETDGKIPKNVLTFGHACSDQRAYKADARAKELPAHGAPFPLSLATFLVQFLSKPGDLVADPFGGSMTTALAAERLGRRFLTCEKMAEFVIGAAYRFRNAKGFRQNLVA